MLCASPPETFTRPFPKQNEHNVDDVLEVVFQRFVTGAVGVGQARKERLEAVHDTFEVVFAYVLGKAADGKFRCACRNIVEGGGKAFNESVLHLIVRVAQRVFFIFPIPFFYGQVTGLVEQRYGVWVVDSIV